MLDSVHQERVLLREVVLQRRARRAAVTRVDNLHIAITTAHNVSATAAAPA
jgi:hypothetical protein